MQGFKNPDWIGQFDQLNQESATSSVKKKCLKPVKISQKLGTKGKSSFSLDLVFKTMFVCQWYYWFFL